MHVIVILYHIKCIFARGENMNIVAQLFGVGAMTFLFLINQQKERKKLIICKMMTDICWVIHYFCLSAVAV